MTQATLDTIRVLTERRSVRHYDETFKLSKQEVEELLEWTTAAPSA